MSKENIQSLIDRVIGKEGILRVPSYWVRKLFNQVLDYTDDSVAKSAKTTEANAITSATATSKEYTDQQIAELGITGKEPVVYVLPEGTLQKMSYPLTDGETYTYTFTDAEAAEYIEALAAGLDKVIFMVGSYENIFVPRCVAERAAAIVENTVTLVSPILVNGSNNDGWYTWAVGFNIDYNPDTGKVTCTRTSHKTDIDIQGSGTEIAVDNKLSSISENPVQNKVIYAELIERFDGIDALLDAINGEEI